MKKELLLLILCLAFYGANAQTLLDENFDDGTRGSMTAVDVDGSTPHPNVGFYTEAWLPAGGALVSNSWYAPAGAANDWLITPELNIDSEGYSFAFKARAVDPSYADGYKVWVSTTGPDVASFTTQLFSVAAENTTLTTRIINLDAYAGQTIHLAIQNDSNDKFLLVVDDVLVAKLKEYNVSAERMVSRRWNASGSTVLPSITVQNKGSETITSVDVALSVDGGSPQTTTVNTNIPGLSSGDITITLPVTVTDNNEYSLDYVLSNPNGNEDEDMSDNANLGYLNSLTGNADKKMVVEEGTGTWCTWCPRGHVAMERMAEDHPDSFIGIAVHNSDPMALAEHDDNMNLNGYPGANINRFTRNVDPGDLSINNITSEAARVSPMNVTSSTEYNATTRELTVTATATSIIDINNADIRFSVIMTEDEVTGTGNDYAQVNAYAGGANGVMGGYESLPNPVPASQMVYHDVSRALLGGFFGEEGSFPEVITAGEEVTYSFTYTIPAIYDDAEMQAVVVVLDAVSGEILNGSESEVQTAVGIFETPELIEAKLSPNPAIDLTTIYLPLETAGDVTVSVLDLSGRLMKNNVYNSNAGNVSFNIITSDLNAGIYIVRVDTPDGVATKRLAVAK